MTRFTVDAFGDQLGGDAGGLRVPARGVRGAGGAPGGGARDGEGAGPGGGAGLRGGRQLGGSRQVQLRVRGKGRRPFPGGQRSHGRGG